MNNGSVNLTAAVKKEQEHVVSRGGNSSVLYLPKEYFTPGEKISSLLEVDSDGNLTMVLTKRLFNFTCNNVRALVKSGFNVEYDTTVAGTKIFCATKEDLSLNCTKSPKELEPTYVALSRQFNQIQSPKDYTELKNTLMRLLSKNLDANMEPEGDVKAIQIFKDPQKYKLKDECEAIEALNETGQKIAFSIIVRFNSKNNNVDQIKAALKELGT